MVLLLLTGCSAGQSNKGKAGNVLFIPKLTGNAFFDAANQGAQQYAQRNGFTVTYTGSPKAQVADQIEIVKQAVADKVDAICISALDAKALDEVLIEAKSKGIAVVTWDADVSGDARQLMVSQGTPEQLGYMLVEMGVKSLIERGIDPAMTAVQYAWHYSQPSAADQQSWFKAGEAYIQAAYPSWINVAPENYYSHQDVDAAVTVGAQVLAENPDIDLIICNDSTALPGQAQALQNANLSAQQVTVTGFCSPNDMREYCKAGVIARWGLWDCQVQGALSCYLAHYLALGNQVKVGDRINVPEIGLVEVMPNTVLGTDVYTAPDSGVVLLPQRSEYTIHNVDDFDF